MDEGTGERVGVPAGDAPGAGLARDVPIPRRAALAGIGAAGVIGTAGLLAACGTGSADAGGTGGDGSGTGGTGGDGDTSPSGGPGGGAARLTTPTSAIPMDSGKIFGQQQVVVTQPSAGDFKAFSAICTHQGCPVKSIEKGSIICPCHGSRFSIVDGSVQSGPAPTPLPPLAVAVDGDELTVT